MATYPLLYQENTEMAACPLPYQSPHRKEVAAFQMLQMWLWGGLEWVRTPWRGRDRGSVLKHPPAHKGRMEGA